MSNKNAAAVSAPEAGLYHIGFIMDGNGRWAKKRGLPRTAGHEAGAKALEKTIKYCHKIELRCLTVYAFSTENWSRSEDEVTALMKLLEKYIKELLVKIRKNALELYSDTEIRFIGDISVLPDRLKLLIAECEAECSGADKKMRLNIALNYGGRSEITHAVAQFMKKYAGRIPTENDISENLYTVGCPPLDLVIRTAGEMRLSNFMLWQSSYAEFYATDVLWPDFGEKELDKAISEYCRRTRKFGGTNDISERE